MEPKEQVSDRIKLDFEQARAKHLLFKTRLRSILYGAEIDEAPVVSQYDCTVGKWIYGHALADYAHISEMRTLEAVHAELHISAKKLVDRYKEGQIEEARMGLEAIEKIADRLVRLLWVVEDKVQKDPSVIIVSKNHSQDLTVNLQELYELQRLNQELDKCIREQSKELYQAKERFELVAKATQDVVWDWDLTTNQVWYNDSFETLFGYKKEEIEPGIDSWYNRLHPEDKKRVIDDIHKVIDGGHQWFAEYRFRRSDGTYSTVYDRGYVLYDTKGKAYRLVGSMADITQRKKTENALEDSERNLRNIILQSPVAMCILRGSSFILEIANTRMFELWGRGAEILLHRPIFDGLPEAAHQGLEELLLHVYITGETYSGSEQPLTVPRNGKPETLFVNFVYEPLRAGDGRISGIIAVAIEVTEQVVARKKVEQSEAVLKRFKFMADNAPDPFILMRENGSFAYLNKKTLEAWGYTEDEVTRLNVSRVDPLYQEKEFSALFARAQKEVIPQFETLYKQKDGHIYPVEVKINGITLNGVQHLFAVARDITERKKAEEVLEKSEARTRLAVEAAHLGTFDIDIVNHTIIHNARTAEIFGFKAATSLAYNAFTDAIYPDDVIVRRQAHEEARQSGELLYEVRILLPDASIRWIRLNGKYMFTNSIPVSMVGTVIDITEEKKAAELLEQKIEERTKELRKLNEQLQQFTYAASHDLQEPLRKITFFLHRLLTNIGPSLAEENTKFADRILHTTERMRLLIDDLLVYSNATSGVTAFEEVDLNDVVKDVLNDMEATIIENEAIIDYQDLPFVKGDPRQLRQLFQNLISNALKYKKKDQVPHVQIRSEMAKGEELQTNIPQSGRNNRFYKIGIKDNGIGFHTDDAKRIFGIFQRLHGKAEYQGIGVGLAIAQKVTENHNGFIWAESESGRGATFIVVLPIEFTGT
jgi:PAS domain S-box-containing protein